jgi:hypothetical protein
MNECRNIERTFIIYIYDVHETSPTHEWSGVAATLRHRCLISVYMQNLLCSRLLSKNLKIKIHRTIILPVVLYGCETLSLTLREEHRLRVFENIRA